MRSGAQQRQFKWVESTINRKLVKIQFENVNIPDYRQQLEKSKCSRRTAAYFIPSVMLENPKRIATNY